MLIVAQPKSASTSLLTSLIELSGLSESCQQFSLGSEDIRDCVPAPEEFPALRGRHKDVGDYSEDLLGHWISAPCFYKQHVVPSAHNLSLLNNRKFVVLLRDPTIHSYEAYLRPGANPVGERRTYVVVNREKLLRELALFNSRHRAISGDILRIFFDELVDQPVRTLRKIFDFFGLNVAVPDGYQLAKERYSGFRINDVKRE